ncbi:hypothetical protein OA957_01395 [Prochlorococcus sp. AH-716-B04]|nr:hypothetical protein [Prochlorococcus sp. AH-716-B04]
MTKNSLKEDQIKDQLLKYIREKSDLDSISEIPLNESLLGEGILDSFAIIELVEFVESEWDIKISDDEFSIDNFGSINKIIDFIIRKFETL